ncbi:MAG TPA: hypothetical protein VJ917_02920 [Saprospiraceae bacterium]|nr:hypothetical protein [Saprospiraceae bacterium]
MSEFSKEEIKSHLSKMKDPIDMDDLINRLILLEKIKQGEKQSNTNQVIGDDQLSKEIQKWSK